VAVDALITTVADAPEPAARAVLSRAADARDPDAIAAAKPVPLPREEIGALMELAGFTEAGRQAELHLGERPEPATPDLSTPELRLRYAVTVAGELLAAPHLREALPGLGAGELASATEVLTKLAARLDEAAWLANQNSG
jgi:hypothetical protein